MMIQEGNHGPAGGPAGQPAIIHELIDSRRSTIAALQDLTDEQLGLAAPWRRQQQDVRFFLLGLAERDDLRRVQLAGLGWQPPEAARILGLTCETHGALHALLVGVPDALIDVVPAPGEWTIRQTLAHMAQTEQRYVLHTAYAVERLQSEAELPLRLPEDRLPPVAPAEGEGSLARLLAELDELRGQTIARLATLQDQELTAATIWMRWEVDARFRLLRFAAHERQHTVQIAKALACLNFKPSEAQMILAQAEISRGRLLALLVGLSDALLYRDPGDGRLAPVMILRQAIEEEAATVARIRAAVPARE